MLPLKPIAATTVATGRPLVVRALASNLSRRTLATQQPHFEMPRDLLEEIQAEHPRPMRIEFLGKEKLSSEALENMDIGLGKHRVPQSLSDKFAYRLVKTLRLLPDTYFGQDHYMRAVMLETIAAGKEKHLLKHSKCDHFHSRKRLNLFF